jgi:uncharacterized protein (DUF2062 family)
VGLLRRVRSALRRLASEHTSTGRLATGIGVGALVGTSPFFGFHIVIGAALARLLRLNQLAVLAGEPVSLPFIAPFLVFASVQVGHRIREGAWASLAGLTLSVEQAGAFVLDWWLGSLLVGSALALVLGGGAYLLLGRFRSQSAPADSVAWTGKSKGTGVGYAIFAATLQRLGRRGGFALLYIVVPWYFLFGWEARRHSDAYLTRVLGPRGWWVRQRDIWRHLHRFARSLVVTLLTTLGRADTEVRHVSQGRHHLMDSLAQGRGAVLLSAHVGARASAQRQLPVQLNIVMFQNEAEAIQKVWDRVDSGPTVNPRPTVIPVNDGLVASA